MTYPTAIAITHTVYDEYQTHQRNVAGILCFFMTFLLLLVPLLLFVKFVVHKLFMDIVTGL